MTSTPNSDELPVVAWLRTANTTGSPVISAELATRYPEHRNDYQEPLCKVSDALAAIAARTQPGMVLVSVDPPEAEIDLLLNELDQIADRHGYSGLPMTNDSAVQSMRVQVAWFFNNWIAAAPAQAASQWRDIATAPKDGTRIQLYWPKFLGGDRFECGQWKLDEYAQKPRPYWRGDCERSYGVAAYRSSPPTHWQPLPPAPEPAETKND